jgi:hypothetical protein
VPGKSLVAVHYPRWQSISSTVTARCLPIIKISACHHADYAVVAQPISLRMQANGGGEETGNRAEN